MLLYRHCTTLHNTAQHCTTLHNTQGEQHSSSKQQRFYSSRCTKAITTQACTLDREPAQLYDDACNVGCTLRNAKTNNLTRWYFEKYVHDKERDLVKTLYRPCSESVRKNPQLAGYTMIVYND